MIVKNKELAPLSGEVEISDLTNYLYEDDETRQKVLDFFNAEDYYCVFTSNASGVLKIVGESYPFDDEGAYDLLSDNHNSVNGIREYCRERGGELSMLLFIMRICKWTKRLCINY